MKKIECRVCHAKHAASATIPIRAEEYTDIQWAVCPKCGVCYPAKEDYSVNAPLDYRKQVRAVAQRAKALPRKAGVKVSTALGNRREDFLRWYLGDLKNLKDEIKKQARAIRRLLPKV